VPTIKLRNSKAAQSDNLIYVKKGKRRSTKKKKLKLIKKNKTKQRRVLWLNVITVDIIDY